MKLATIRVPRGVQGIVSPGDSAGATRAVKAEGNALIDLGATDLGAFLAVEGWQDRAAAENAIAGFTVRTPSASEVAS